VSNNVVHEVEGGGGGTSFVKNEFTHAFRPVACYSVSTFFSSHILEYGFLHADGFRGFGPWIKKLRGGDFSLMTHTCITSAHYSWNHIVVVRNVKYVARPSLSMHRTQNWISY